VLVENPLWIADNQKNIVINIHQDFAASAHSNFFRGQTDWGLLCWSNNSGETWLCKQEEGFTANFKFQNSDFFTD
jgi:hypothetical protein